MNFRRKIFENLTFEHKTLEQVTGTHKSLATHVLQERMLVRNFQKTALTFFS